MTPLYHPRPEHWPQLTLRRFFALMTFLCLFLGYEINWIQQRNRYIAEKDAIWASVCDQVLQPGNPKQGMIEFGRGRVSAPFLLSLLGERGISRIQACVLVDDPDDDDVVLTAWQRETKLAKGLFPEARSTFYWVRKGE